MVGWNAMSVGGIADMCVNLVPCNPVVLDSVETLIAFEQGMVDVIFYDPDMVLNLRLYEIARYGLVSAPIARHQFLCMNLKQWNSFSPELQDIIQNKVYPEVEAWILENSLRCSQESLEKLVSEHGMIINQMPQEEVDEFRFEGYALAEREGYLKYINADLLELADNLRSEPYDEGPLHN